jgi:hypothetical protein
MSEIRMKLIRLYLPSVTVHNLGASLLDDLMYGSMGQFVRQMLEESTALSRGTINESEKIKQYHK